NSNENAESLSSYLDFLNAVKEGTDLTSLINSQFEAARAEVENLNDNFAQQIESDNSKVLSAYDELQMNVVYLKVDMLQALNINVDYVDADGD
ncbi:MAG: peptidase M75 superfamily protein, partial [Balneolaceae bacterium]